MKKKTLLFLTTACFLTTAGAATALQYQKADTPQAFAEETAGIKMENGAFVRLGTVNGLRFQATMTKEYYEALTGTEITLKSTITANEHSETVEWVLKDIEFENGVTKFYHTLNFANLSAENLKLANAMEFSASFSLDSNVDTEDWNSETTTPVTRSMRQVAYTAYNTKGAVGYENEALLKYFSLGEDYDTEVVYDADTEDTVSADTKIVDIKQEKITATSAYLFDENGLTDISADTTISAEFENLGETKTIVYFDENNTAYTVQTRYVTKYVETEADVMDMLQLDGEADNEYTTSGYHLLAKDFKGIQANEVDTTAKKRNFIDFTLDGDGHTLGVSMVETHTYGLFPYTENFLAKNVVLDLTKDFVDKGETLYGAPDETDFMLCHTPKCTTKTGVQDSTVTFENAQINLKRAAGDTAVNFRPTSISTTANYGGIFPLCNTNSYKNHINMKYTLINIADDFFVTNDTYTLSWMHSKKYGMTVNFGRGSETYNTYVISNQLKQPSQPQLSAQLYTLKISQNIATAIDSGEKFLLLRESGYWTLDEAKKTLVIGNTAKSPLATELKAVYDTEYATATIKQIAALEGITATNAYLSTDETKADISASALSAVFTTEEAAVSTTKTVIVTDENNTEYSIDLRYVTKIVDNETELREMLQLDATADGTTTGYYLLNNDIAITMNNQYKRYAANFTLDGNGHTLTVSMPETHYYGFFYDLTDSTVKNVKLDITKDFSNESNTDIDAAASGYLMTFSTSGSVFENVEMNFHRAEGDTDISPAISTNVCRLYLCGYNNGRITMKHTLVKIDDGFFIAEEGVDLQSKKNGIRVYGYDNSSYGNYVIHSEKITADSSASKYIYQPSIEAAIEAGDNFLTLREGGYWTLDKTEKTLTFGETVKINPVDEVSITQTPIFEDFDFTDSSLDGYVSAYKDFKTFAEKEYLVPGLLEGFIPQGMDIWDAKNMLLISGYFTDTTNSPSSMILGIDLTTGEYVGTYLLKNTDGSYHTSHVGGIAVTEKNIFLSNGGALLRIPLSQVEEVGNKGTLTIVEKIGVPVAGSFCNYANGVLWVGDYYYSKASAYDSVDHAVLEHNGAMYYTWIVGYTLVDSTESELSETAWNSSLTQATPDYVLATLGEKVQGFTMTNDYIMLSQSYSSGAAHIGVYENPISQEAQATTELNGVQVGVWFLETESTGYTSIPYSEAITMYGDKLLVLYESGSNEYKNNSKYSTDYVWSITINSKDSEN